jgi:steroid 5-alpha reductase family enzyme
MGDGSPLSEKPAHVYVIISAVALAIGHALAYPFDQATIVWLSFGINWALFVPAAILQDERFFDLVGAITNASLAAFSLYTASEMSTRRLLVTALVIIWALRLGSFLFIRVLKVGEDSRFTEIKKNPARFFNVWSLQATWCLFNVLGVIILNSASMTEVAALPFSNLDFVGLALWTAGFALEVAADTEKNAFREDPMNKGNFISTGVWSWSRHPNYAGEIMLWVGLTVICSSSFSAAGFGPQWLGLWSPCFVTLLLTKVSGIPMLEKKSDDKWGDDAAYKSYKASTPVLFPVVYAKG